MSNLSPRALALQQAHGPGPVDWERVAEIAQPVWRPIELAPKDSKGSLVWCPDRQNTYVVSWWQGEGADHCWVHFGGLHGELMEEATHWMPLPEPPACGAKIEGTGRG